MARGRRIAPPARSRGYFLVVLLFALLLFGLGAATVGEWESVVSQREREAELLRTGSEVVAAIREYYVNSPGMSRFPRDWEDLLEDRRFIGLVRHLRRVPVDPFTHASNWTLVRDPQGNLLGVRSTSTQEPLARVELHLGDLTLAPAAHYSEWSFSFDPGTIGAPPSGVRR